MTHKRFSVINLIYSGQQHFLKYTILQQNCIIVYLYRNISDKSYYINTTWLASVG